MKIDQKLVEHVAALARLELQPDEVGYYQTHMAKILSYVEQLATMPDPLGSDWRSDTLAPGTPERPDVMLPSLPLSEVLANAPARGDSAFQVPKVLE